MSFLDIFLFLFVAFFALEIRPLKNDEQGFGIETTATLRGLAMLGIILHHIHNRFGFASPMLQPTGYLATGLFFFISGYGNMISLNKRDSVKLNWLGKKLTKIYVPFFASYWLYYLILLIFYPEFQPTGGELLEDLFTISFPNQVSWFPKIILMCFSLHWLARRIFSNSYGQSGFVFLFAAIYFIYMRLSGYPDYWYKSVLCYPLGCFIARCFFLNGLMDNKGKKMRVLGFALSAVVFFISFVLSRKIWLIQFLSALSFAISCFFFCYTFKSENKLFSWIGKNSFEFYVFHTVFLQAFSRLIGYNRYLYTLLVLACSFIFVYIYLLLKNSFPLQNRPKE